MIEVKGLEKIFVKYKIAPDKMRRMMEDTMDASIEEVNKGVPRYPSPRPNQKYKRTGMLGRSLGSGFGGGKHGPPDIQDVNFGPNYVEGIYGSRLPYAQYVIGYGTQAWMHRGRWWTNNALAIKATKKVVALWNRLAENFVKWFNS